MKKFSICLLMIISLFITGCGNKTKVAITLEDFSQAATDKHFVVMLEDYTGVSYINEARVASMDGIEIQMINYTEAKYAEKVQNEQIDSFNLLKTTGAWEKKDSGKNYYRYEIVSNGYYMINTRVDNTLIYCKTLLENKDTVQGLFNELGY